MRAGRAAGGGRPGEVAALARLLADPATFSRATLPERALRSYQTEPVRAVAAARVGNDSEKASWTGRGLAVYAAPCPLLCAATRSARFSQDPA